jgi:sortase A
MDHRPERSPRRLVRVGGPIVAAVVAGGGVVLLTASGDTATEADGALGMLAPATTPSTSTTTASTTTSTTTTTAPSTTTTSTTTTSTTTTTLFPSETLPAIPDGPVSPPADPRGLEPEIQLGGIEIPRLDVSEPLYEGIRLTTLDKGPGHWPGTALPGRVGNVVIAAHRTSHGGPFRHIDQLVEGDEVVFHTADGVLTYRVTTTMVVDPDAVWIIDQTDTATATLFACHPPGSVAQRIVVQLALDG